MNGGKTNSRKLIVEGLWHNNPVFKQVLGICSTLAVTNLVLNTVVMCVALMFTLSLSACTVSILRSFTPRNIRMMVETLIIGFYVIIVDVLLKAYWPEMSGNLGPYVGLIITNCIIMGRAEAYAMKNPAGYSILDGIGNGLGYSVLLLSVGIVRELFGSGKLFGQPIFVLTTEEGWYEPNGVLLLSPSAFVLIGLFIWALRTWKTDQVEEEN